MDELSKTPKRSGRLGARLLVLIAVFSCGFWFYQGVQRRHRLEWIASVRSLGLPVSVIPASQWTARMYVPGPQGIVDRDIVIVNVDTESQGKALLDASPECPSDVKIYAFDGLSTKRYSQIEERFPTAVLFTRLQY